MVIKQIIVQILIEIMNVFVIHSFHIIMISYIYHVFHGDLRFLVTLWP